MAEAADRNSKGAHLGDYPWGSMQHPMTVVAQNPVILGKLGLSDICRLSVASKDVREACLLPDLLLAKLPKALHFGDRAMATSWITTIVKEEDSFEDVAHVLVNSLYTQDIEPPVIVELISLWRHHHEGDYPCETDLGRILGKVCGKMEFDAWLDTADCLGLDMGHFNFVYVSERPQGEAGMEVRRGRSAWVYDAMYSAGNGGHLDLVRMLLCALSEKQYLFYHVGIMLHCALRNGHTNIFMWAVSSPEARDVFDTYVRADPTFAFPAVPGDQGFYIGMIKSAITSGNLDVVKWMFKSVAEGGFGLQLSGSNRRVVRNFIERRNVDRNKYNEIMQMIGDDNNDDEQDN